jgi:tripartite-type tricarboxylate transporter receptor subunit TctC
MMFYGKIARAAAALGMVLITPAMQHAQAIDAYEGKNVSVVVGFTPGGTYDLYARVLSRHMGRHLPGNPHFVVQNMPGAGGIKAASYLYSVAAKDGTVIGTFARGNVIGPLLGEGQFDSTKFNWIGSVTDDVNVCLAWHTAKVKTWDDLMSLPFTVAGQGPEADPNIYAELVNHAFGTSLKIINGYPGSTEIGLAMERGEVDGVCALSYSTVKSSFKAKLDNKLINIVFQAGLKKAADLPDVPLLLDKAKNAQQSSILMFIMGVQGMARPFMAPPDLPADRVAMLRQAFAKTMQDPAFLAEAAKSNLPVNPASGEDVQKLVGELYRTPPDVIEKAKAAISMR